MNEQNSNLKLVNSEYLLSYIKENNLTKKEFASRCGIKVQNLNTVLKGGPRCKITYLIAIADYLQVSLHKIINTNFAKDKI